MRLSRSRLLPAAAVLALLPLAGWSPASAASAPSTLLVKDAPKDAVGGQADMEILGLTFTTAGTTVTKRVKGKLVKTYTPKRIVISMNLSAPPSKLPVTNYQIDATTSVCGDMSLYYDGQNTASGGLMTNCGPTTALGDTLYLDEPVVTGKSIVWSVPFSQIPKALSKGGRFTDIHGFLSVAEPTTGAGSHEVDEFIDEVSSASTYKVG